MSSIKINSIEEFKGFFRFPKKHIKTVELDLSGLSIFEIPGSICHLKKLEVLNLSNTFISYLPFELLELKNLKSLDLSNTLISEIPFHIEGLINLNVSNTQIQYVPLNREIKKLKIDNTLVKNLYEAKQRRLPLKSLEELSILGTPLESLPSLKGMLNLVSLQISDSRIKTIENIDSLSYLQVLVLENNPMHDLPNGLWELGELQILILNKLPLNRKFLNCRFDRLNKLRALSLSQLPIESLPKEIGLLENLEVLHLEKLPVNTLAREIGQLENLRELFIKDINIEYLPVEISNLPSDILIHYQDSEMSLPDFIKLFPLKQTGTREVQLFIESKDVDEIDNAKKVLVNFLEKIDVKLI